MMVMGKQAKRPLSLTVPVSEFKARCLELFSTLLEQDGEIIVTRRGQPIARITPRIRRPRPIGGAFKGRIKIVGDIINCHEEWETM